MKEIKKFTDYKIFSSFSPFDNKRVNNKDISEISGEKDTSKRQEELYTQPKIEKNVVNLNFILNFCMI